MICLLGLSAVMKGVNKSYSITKQIKESTNLDLCREMFLTWQNGKEATNGLE